MKKNYFGLIAEKVARDLKDLGAARDRLEQLELEVEAQAGEEGRLFGSVTAAQVAELIGEKGIEIDRRKIDLAEPIKEVGEHSVPIRLHREVIANVRLKVTTAE